MNGQNHFESPAIKTLSAKLAGTHPRPALALDKPGPSQKPFDWLFGYDYFIAHCSVDGKEYASALYDGDVWNFVEQWPSLGIKNLDNKHPKRPRSDEASKELQG